MKLDPSKKYVYQLRAEGACLGQFRELRSSTVFTTKEKAVERMPAFKERVTNPANPLRLEDDAALVLRIDALEIIE